MTVAELNLFIEAYSNNQKEAFKRDITTAFYGAYFQLKGQKGLSGKDLQSILDKIDGNGSEMSDEEMFKVLKQMTMG